VKRQIGDLIEEQSATFGGLDEPLLIGDCAGEAALLVTEELAFHELGGDCAAVDGHERSVTAGARVMNQLCDELFARA